MSRILPYASGWYLLSLLLFSCALMSKTMVVSLPLLFLLLDWWPLHRLQRSTLKYLVVEKLPFLVLSAVAGLLTVHAERGVGAVAMPHWCRSSFVSPMPFSPLGDTCCKCFGRRIWLCFTLTRQRFPPGRLRGRRCCWH